MTIRDILNERSVSFSFILKIRKTLVADRFEIIPNWGNILLNGKVTMLLIILGVMKMSFTG